MTAQAAPGWPPDLPHRDDPRRRRRARGRRRPRRRVLERGRRPLRLRASTGPSTSSAASPSTRTACAIRDEDVAACGGGRRRSSSAPSAARSGTTRTPAVRPEQALFALRGGLGLYANLRPVTRPPGARRRVAAAPGAARRRRHAHRPRADRRHLLRRAVGGAPGADGRADARRHAAVHRARDPARRPARLRAGARPPQAASRSVDKANVLATSRLWRTVVDEVARRVPGRRRSSTSSSTPCAMLLVRRPADFDVHRHREPVRRHPVRRGERPGRLAGDAAVGVARRAADGARHVRPVRADPRLGAGHRRAGPRQPDRHDPVGGDAAALVARPRRRGRRRSRRRSRARSTTAAGPRDLLRDVRRRGRRARASSARPAMADGRRRARSRQRAAGAAAMTAGRPATARSSSTTRPCATARRARTSSSRWPTSCAIARMLDEFGMPYIEGGWPGSNPKDIEFFAAARSIALGDARSWPPSARRATAPTGPRTTRTCASSSPPRRRSSRSSARAGCSTSPRSWARRRPRTST